MKCEVEQYVCRQRLYTNRKDTTVEAIHIQWMKTLFLRNTVRLSTMLIVIYFICIYFVFFNIYHSCSVLVWICDLLTINKRRQLTASCLSPPIRASIARSEMAPPRRTLCSEPCRSSVSDKRRRTKCRVLQEEAGPRTAKQKDDDCSVKHSVHIADYAALDGF